MATTVDTPRPEPEELVAELLAWIAELDLAARQHGAAGERAREALARLATAQSKYLGEVADDERKRKLSELVDALTPVFGKMVATPPIPADQARCEIEDALRDLDLAPVGAEALALPADKLREHMNRPDKDVSYGPRQAAKEVVGEHGYQVLLATLESTALNPRLHPLRKRLVDKEGRPKNVTGSAIEKLVRPDSRPRSVDVFRRLRELVDLAEQDPLARGLDRLDPRNRCDEETVDEYRRLAEELSRK